MQPTFASIRSLVFRALPKCTRITKPFSGAERFSIWKLTISVLSNVLTFLFFSFCSLIFSRDGAALNMTVQNLTPFVSSSSSRSFIHQTTCFQYSLQLWRNLVVFLHLELCSTFSKSGSYILILPLLPFANLSTITIVCFSFCPRSRWLVFAVNVSWRQSPHCALYILIKYSSQTFACYASVKRMEHSYLHATASKETRTKPGI